MAWENIKDHIKTSAKGRLGLHELKQHIPWFDEDCSGFIDQRKQAKMQWLHDANQSNVDNLNNLGREGSKYSRNKRKEHLRAKID